MGNQQARFKRPIQTTHPRLGNISKVYDNNNSQYYQKTVTVIDQTEVNKWQHGLSWVQKHSIKTLFLPLQSQTQKGGLCTRSAIVKVRFFHQLYYPAFRQMLSQNLEYRKTLNNYFSNEQIYQYIYKLCQIGQIFEQRKEKAGNVHPENILLNQRGDFKLINKYSWPGQPIGTLKAYQSGKGIYLCNPSQQAPQQIIKFQKKNLFQQDQEGQSDAFAIGMTILAMGNLKNIDDCYDFYQGLINGDKIQKYKDQFGSRYRNPFLQRIMDNFLHPEVSKRPSCGEVKALLQPYRNEILNHKGFIPNKQLSRMSIESYNQSKYQNGNRMFMTPLKTKEQATTLSNYKSKNFKY